MYAYICSSRYNMKLCVYIFIYICVYIYMCVLMDTCIEEVLELCVFSKFFLNLAQNTKYNMYIYI